MVDLGVRLTAIVVVEALELVAHRLDALDVLPLDHQQRQTQRVRLHFLLKQVADHLLLARRTGCSARSG